ncbi:MAG: hypothetical protein H0W72_16705 [Planctomycetes bacterium]|nr:hypothetical protein [Planctomycetota bacterium]
MTTAILSIDSLTGTPAQRRAKLISEMREGAFLTACRLADDAEIFRCERALIEAHRAVQAAYGVRP